MGFCMNFTNKYKTDRTIRQKKENKQNVLKEN